MSQEELLRLREQRRALISRYSLTRLHGDEDIRAAPKVRWGIWNRPKVSLVGALTYSVRLEDVGRPDKIAYSFYSNSNYWWVIMSVNKLKDPFLDLVPGLVLAIPTPDAVELAMSDVYCQRYRH